MKITEKNTPILRALREKKFGQWYIFDKTEINTDEFIEWFKSDYEKWKELCDVFSNNIEYVTSPFLEAIQKNRNKLATIENICKLSGPRYQGTMFFKTHDKDQQHIVQYCYDFSILPDSIRIIHHFMAFIDDKIMFIVRDCPEINKESYSFLLPSLPPGFEPEDDEDPEASYIHASLNDIINVILFKKYADVETVEAKSFKKVPFAPEPDGKILLDSTLKVKCLDCSWFRTIVRTEGFLVRGHLRLQPYKNDKGEWDYKLIYIDTFQKHGYVRRAKKEQQDQ